MKKMFPRILAACLSVCMAGVFAEDVQKAEGNAKRMRMHEPMATGMTKPGMKKGDVRSAAEKKAREMQPMMEQEEKSMPQDQRRRDKPPR